MRGARIVPNGANARLNGHLAALSSAALPRSGAAFPRSLPSSPLPWWHAAAAQPPRAGDLQRGPPRRLLRRRAFLQLQPALPRRRAPPHRVGPGSGRAASAAAGRHRLAFSVTNFVGFVTGLRARHGGPASGGARSPEEGRRWRLMWEGPKGYK
jgi:hypothetical protein